jgi:hypothetical protein
MQLPNTKENYHYMTFNKHKHNPSLLSFWFKYIFWHVSQGSIQDLLTLH